MIDRRPALIVRPRAPTTSSPRSASPVSRISSSPSDAAATASPASRPATTGIVIDLSRMRGVAVDPGARSARVRGGSLLAELDDAAQAHGLVCPVGVVSHTGVAGLTLGGGMGRLQRKLGLTIDSLRRRRARDRRRPSRAGERGRGSRALLGHPGRRRELRDRDVVRVPPASLRRRRHARTVTIRSSGRELAELYRELVADGPDELWTSSACPSARMPRGPTASCPSCTADAADAERVLAGLRALDDPLEDSVESGPPCRPSVCSTRRWSGASASRSRLVLGSLPATLDPRLGRPALPGARRSRGWLLGVGLGPRDRAPFPRKTPLHRTRSCLLGSRRIVSSDRRARRGLPCPGRAPRPTPRGAARIRRALRRRRHRGRRRRRTHGSTATRGTSGSSRSSASGSRTTCFAQPNIGPSAARASDPFVAASSSSTCAAPPSTRTFQRRPNACPCESAPPTSRERRLGHASTRMSGWARVPAARGGAARASPPPRPADAPWGTRPGRPSRRANPANTSGSRWSKRPRPRSPPHHQRDLR